MKHSFKIFYEPAHDRDLDSEIRSCGRCGLEVKNPQDVYPITECGPVEAMTDKWFGLMGYGTDCNLRIVEFIHES